MNDEYYKNSERIILYHIYILFTNLTSVRVLIYNPRLRNLINTRYNYLPLRVYINILIISLIFQSDWDNLIVSLLIKILSDAPGLMRIYVCCYV